MFLGREEELKLLQKARDDLLKGKGSIYFIYGIKGGGKTSLLNKFSSSVGDIDVIYIDIKRQSLSPELFSLYFIGNIFFFLAKQEGDKADYFNLTFQKTLIEELNEERITRHITKFYKELEKKKPDYTFLLKLVFQFPSLISKALSIPLVVLLDEFQELSFLANYRIDPYKLFKEEIGDNVLWVLASSKKSLSLYFENSLSLPPLSFEDTKGFLLNFDEEAKKRLFAITGGIPYPFSVLLERIGKKEIVDSFLVEKALEEEIKEQGRLYHYCEQMMDSAINEARGEGLIRAALISLAKNPNANLTSIAKQIRRSTGVTKSLLSRLIETEIVECKEKRYFIPNQLFALWINIYYYGKKLEIKEEIVEMLKIFNGQKVPGEIFGKTEEVFLPKFLSVDLVDQGLIEARTEKEKWLIKVFKQGIAQEEDIEELKSKAEKANSIPWFISRDGFSADVFLQKTPVMLSIGDDIKALQEILTKGG